MCVLGLVHVITVCVGLERVITVYVCSGYNCLCVCSGYNCLYVCSGYYCECAGYNCVRVCVRVIAVCVWSA